jgi:predicted MFS family arabinose efflux permease
MVFFTMSIPIEVVFAQRTLHAGAKGYGVLLSAWGAGAIVGSGVYARWRALPSRSLITLGSFLLALGFAVMVIAHSLLAAAIGAAISGVGNTTELVAMRTALQESVSDRWMALIVSLSESIIQAAPGAGILLGGAVTALAGPRAGFAVAAGGSLVVGAAAWLRLNLGVAQPVPTASPAAPKSDQPLTAAVPRQ